MERWSLAVALGAAAAGATGALVACLRTCRRTAVAHAATALLLSAVTAAVAGAALAVGPDEPGLVLPAVVTAGIYGATVAGWFVVRAATDPSWRPPAGPAWLVWGAPQVALVATALGGTLPADFGTVTLALGALADDDGAEVVLSLERLLLLGVWLLTLRRVVLTAWAVPRFARRSLTTLGIAASLATVALAATVPHPHLLGGTDPVPLSLTLVALLHVDVLLRARLGFLVPPSGVHVLDTMDDAVVVVDPAGTLVALNLAARRLAAGALGGSVDDLLGRPVEEVMRPAVAAASASVHGTTTSFSLGSHTHLEARTTPLLDAFEQPAGVVVVCREVTDAVALRTQLEAAQTQLERERARLEDLTRRLMTELSTKEQERTRLAEDAVRDPLTGVHNRRRLQPAVAAAMARSRESGRPFAVMVVDVDHFKVVNDTYGHGVGDRVLQQLASELVIVGRPGDTVVRYGGEEFVVVVPDVTPLRALQRAEEIRRAVGELRVPVRAEDTHMDAGPGDSLRVTVSVGVACYPDNAGTVEALLGAADDALYAAKESGRDCVVSA